MKGKGILSRHFRIFKHFSPFATACACVAIAYIGYRAFTILGPNGLWLFIDKPVAVTDIGCSEDVDNESELTVNSMPLISEQHQQYIQRLPAAGPNLVSNASLEKIDPNTMLPVGFFWTHETSYLKYSFMRDDKTQDPFLRVQTDKKLDENEPAGSWVTNPIPIEPDASYAYSFSYRANVPVSIQPEYILANGEYSYETITIVDGIGEWRRFSYYMNNFRGAPHFRIILSTREKGYIDTRSYDIHKIASARLDNAIVSIAFDDGWQSIADNAMPLLQKMRIPTTQYVITETVDKKVPLYMSIDTLRNIRQAGHEIGSHSLTHCDQTKLSNNEILQNAKDSKAWLEARKLGPVTSFAYPYGRYDDNTQPLVARAYRYIRTSDAGYNDRYFDAHNIRTMIVLNTTTEDEIRSWLEYAARNKVWLVITYHRVNEHGPYSITTQQLEQQLNVIKRSGLKILPISQAAKTIRP